MREIYWTYERCKEEGRKYKTRKEFKYNAITAYKKSIKNNWIDVFDHMIRLIKPNGYWTYERSISNLYFEL
jgi:hypothetical protein